MLKNKTTLSALMTLLILACPLPSSIQTLAFLLCWVLCLKPFRRAEILAFVTVNLIFIFMDIGAIKNGLFYFNHPDLLGLPYWEFFAWGYLCLVAHRLSSTTSLQRPSFILAIAFALIFGLIQNQGWLNFSSWFIVAAMIVYFRKTTIPISIYALVYGIAFEVIGVKTGQWSYPQVTAPLIFPLWGLAMWVGTWNIFANMVSPVIKNN